MRVHLLVEAPFTKRDYNRFGIDDLRSAGHAVQVWDLSHLFRPRSRLQYLDLATGVSPLVFSSESQVLRAIGSLNDEDAVIALAGATRSDWHRYRHLWSHLGATKALLTAVSVGHIPQGPWGLRPDHHIGNAVVLAKHLAVRQWSSAKYRAAKNNFIREVVSRKSRGGSVIRPLDAVFFGTSFEPIAPPLLGGGTRLIPIHNLDYDLILRSTASSTPWHESDLIVFLDGIGPTHPDSVTLDGYNPKCSAEVYSEEIDKVLSAIERAVNQPVSIAAHPRSKPGVAETKYRGRPVLYGAPPDYLASARWILMAHASTLMASAAFFERPVSFIDSDRFDDLDRVQLRHMRRLVGAGLIDAGNLEGVRAPQINQRRYRAYVRTYLKGLTTPERPFWRVVADTLPQLR